MQLNSTSYKGDSTSYIPFSDNTSEPVTIKVFDIRGMKAKTIDLSQDLNVYDLRSKMIDLEKGVYILNAFKKGNFVKSFRFIKD